MSAVVLPVGDEPHHEELFTAAGVRVYRAVLPPGLATWKHRHDRDTRYVVAAGGRLRSDEPGRQRPGTRVGHSTPAPRKLAWLLSRSLGRGWISASTGTVLVQPHESRPLVHRVCAHPENRESLVLVGVELPPSTTGGVRLRAPVGAGRVEYADDRGVVVRERVLPTSPTRREAEKMAVLVVLHGTGWVVGSTGAELRVGSVVPVRGCVTVHAHTNLDLVWVLC